MDTTTNNDDDTLSQTIDNASIELANQYKVERIAAPMINHVKQQTNLCSRQIQDTEQTTYQVQKDTLSCREALDSLRKQMESLQKSFATIDQLEVIVNQMNGTLGEVAANVDEIEKTVQSSIQQKPSLSMPFLFSKRLDSPLQPYFPPPQPVDIPSSKLLFDSLDDPFPL